MQSYRKQLLQQKPANRQNWIAYLIAAHLAGDLPLALKLVEVCFIFFLVKAIITTTFFQDL